MSIRSVARPTRLSGWYSVAEAGISRARLPRHVASTCRSVPRWNAFRPRAFPLLAAFAHAMTGRLDDCEELVRYDAAPSHPRSWHVSFVGQYTIIGEVRTGPCLPWWKIGLWCR